VVTATETEMSAALFATWLGNDRKDLTLLLFCDRKVVKLMTRMGKMVPESGPATTPSVVSVKKTPQGSTAAADSTTTLKKVYCTPKINFVGEILYMCVWNHRQ